MRHTPLIVLASLLIAGCAVSVQQQRQEWEYRVLDPLAVMQIDSADQLVDLALDTDKRRAIYKRLEDELTRLGQDGWEMIESPERTLIMRRPR